MTAIYLIRHGQASFAEQDYDKLSVKGIEQANILGQYWHKVVSSKINVNLSTQYYSGSLLRHEQTAEHFFNGLSKSQVNTNPANDGVITHAGFNELDHVDILSRYNENWRSFQAMCSSVKRSGNNQSLDKTEMMRSFQQEFIQAMKRWISGDFDDYKESWPQFKQRCINSLQEAVTQINDNEPSNKKDLVIFTSGGVIGVIVGHILGLDNQQSLQVSQQLVNSSVTKVIATNDGFKLNYLNNYSHLELVGQEWLSYF